MQRVISKLSLSTFRSDIRCGEQKPCIQIRDRSTTSQIELNRREGRETKISIATALIPNALLAHEGRAVFALRPEFAFNSHIYTTTIGQTKLTITTTTTDTAL